MKVISFYQAYNKDMPSDLLIKKFIKRVMIEILPVWILAKIFPKPGATGFLAKKI